MGRSVSGIDAFDGEPHELPERPAVLQAFKLDRFEVTVGRFRNFLAAGAPGYRMMDVTSLRREIACGAGNQTWTAAPGLHENKPINCVSWAAADAFCHWVEGRLPSEAEWERAATGGDENRLYPWGQESPAPHHDRFGCLVEGEHDCSTDDIASVHSHQPGAGRWGHQHLAGNVMEHVLDFYDADWYSQQPVCQDCVNFDAGSLRIRRGGSHRTGARELRAAHRYYDLPDAIDSSTGFRCAYNVENEPR